MTEHVILDSRFNQERALRQKVLLFAVFVAVFYGLWFGVVAVNLGRNILAAIDFTMAGLFLWAGYIAIKNPESLIPERLVASSTSIFFLYLFASGGNAGIGPLWSFVLPLIVFFLAGFKGGVVLSLLYLSACGGIFLYNRFFPGLFYEHGALFVERFIGIYLLATVVSGAYEFQKCRTEILLLRLLEDGRIARARAEAANEAKSNFLAIVSHEIRTPINGINGMIELMNGTSLTADQKKYAELMRSSCNTLLSLIKDILDLAKIESGKMLLEQTEFNLKHLIDETVAQLQVKAMLKQLKISLKLGDELQERVIGDPVRLRQILANLLDNAVKFTAAGEIMVKVGADSKSSTPGHVLFEVLDSGIGIAPDKLSILFQDFHQADSSTARVYGGTGLGLAISRRLVSLMGGEIGVESQPDKGSRFFFRIQIQVQR